MQVGVVVVMQDDVDLKNVDAMVSQFPLPDGMDDAVLNRQQMGAAMNVSENTITKYLSQGMPCESAGGNGQEYQLRLSHCYAWRRSKDEAEAALKRKGDDAARRAASLFRNLPSDLDDDAPMTPLELRQASEAEYHYQRAAKQRGELLQVEDVRSVFERIIVDFRVTIETVVDFCELEFGLKSDEILRLQERCDDALAGARFRMTKITDQVEGSLPIEQREMFEP